MRGKSFGPRLALTLGTVLAAALLLSACASSIVRNPVPAAIANTVTVPGLAHARFWGDEVPKDIRAAMRQRMPNLGNLPAPREYVNGQGVVHYLALSGGGAYGAFGAGLLAGWSKSRTRPVFDVVTGISAGGLIAPFAYLGSDYDRQLEEIWTKYGEDELIRKEPLGVLFGASAAVDNTQLAELIAKYINHQFLAAVAREYRRGRILLIGTTNLDSKRPVVWNMGEIAVSANPHALQLFRDVLLASAALPGIMPPVKIMVDGSGETFEEYHVDGGVTRQVFLTPVALRLTDFDQFYPSPPLRRIYVIRNGGLRPRYSSVDPSAAAIATSSLSTLLDSQTSGDIFRIYVGAERDGAEFRLAAEQSNLEPASGSLFDKVYMKKLFDQTQAIAVRGYPWLRTVPEVHAAGAR